MEQELMPTARLPAAPLIKIMDDEERSKIGVDRIQKMLENGIRFSDADRMAVARGYHPIELWGDAWLGNYPDQVETIINEVLDILQSRSPMSKTALMQSITTKAGTELKRTAVKTVIEAGFVVEERVRKDASTSHMLRLSK
jgi:hypothetical protein